MSAYLCSKSYIQGSILGTTSPDSIYNLTACVIFMKLSKAISSLNRYKNLMSSPHLNPLSLQYDSLEGMTTTPHSH